MPFDAIIPPTSDAARAKAVKECFIAADRYIKSKMFDKAREEVERARGYDPGNVYVSAYNDRIKHFEEAHQKYVKFVEDQQRGIQSAMQSTSPVPQSAPQPRQPVPTAPKPVPVQQVSASGLPADLQDELNMMRRQILELTSALKQEKRAREAIQQQQMESSISEFRAALRQAWRFGAPKEPEALVLQQLAGSLGISSDVVESTTREVKLEMYGGAVKEVIAKRKLIRSSSSMLDWLRKVYQVSVTEYLEYESRFLLDLVTDQYRGTILFVAFDESTRIDLVPRLKSSGFAVVQALNPESALEKIEKVNPTAIVCDTAYPPGSLSGSKFLNVLRVNSKFNFLPFILLCSEQEARQLESSELRPNEGFVQKPADFDTLSELLNDRLIRLREYISSIE